MLLSGSRFNYCKPLQRGTELHSGKRRALTSHGSQHKMTFCNSHLTSCCGGELLLWEGPDMHVCQRECWCSCTSLEGFMSACMNVYGIEKWAVCYWKTTSVCEGVASAPFQDKLSSASSAAGCHISTATLQGLLYTPCREREWET